MKVLRIWHAAVVSEYRKKIRALAKQPSVEIVLLIPPSWREGGRQVSYTLDSNVDQNFKIVVGRIRGVNNIRRYLFLTQLYKTMASFKPDIIDIEEEPYAFITTQVLVYRKLLRLNAEVIFHSAHNIARQMEAPFEFLQKHAFRQCKAALVRNIETKAYLEQRGFKARIFLSGNGLDLEHFSPGDAPVLQKKLQLSEFKVIGYAGKLTGAKGIMTLLDAFRRLPKGSILLLIGEGQFQERIIGFSQEYGFTDRLRTVGAVNHEDMPDYYRLMDVCVLPSETTMRWKESFGRVLVEAMACGVPVIGSDSGAIPETLGQAGLIFPEKDVEALSEKIRDILDKPVLRKCLVTAGLKRARDFSWETIASINYKAYEEVLRR